MRPSSFSVLVVDDETTTLTLIAQLLESLGIRDVDTAGNGADALSMLEALQYHLVIADWHMKPLSGLELLRKMRSNRRFDAVPFIMISADTHSELERSAWESGADAFLRKPFDVTALREKLTDAMKRDPNDVRAGPYGGGVILDFNAAMRSRSG